MKDRLTFSDVEVSMALVDQLLIFSNDSNKNKNKRRRRLELTDTILLLKVVEVVNKRDQGKDIRPEYMCWIYVDV